MLEYSAESIETLFSLKSLQAIVENVSSLIQHDVVICNQDGVIIAASSQDRIGIPNQNVKKMIESNGDYHLVYPSASDTLFRPGINLPVRYEKKPVGAVGITGDPDEVKDFGRVIQAMVERQLYDLVYQFNLAEKKRIISDFVYSWIYKGSSLTPEEFHIRSHSLGIDDGVPRVICVLDGREDSSSAVLLDQTMERMCQFVENRLSKTDSKHIVTILNNRIVVLLHTDQVEKARRIMEKVRQEIFDFFNVRCGIGISNHFTLPSEAKDRYTVARQACKISCAKPDRSIVVFGSYDLEPLLSTMNPTDLKRLYCHFFRNFKNQEQIEEAVLLLNVYTEKNRSIQDTALEMNMHKNTVQCRLDRIADLTGYNPRVSKDLAYIYFVLMIHKIGIQ